MIEALKEIGCNTAKAVLALAPEEIMERADLEEQTVDDLLRVLSAEFEDEAQPAPDDYAPEEEQPVDTTDASEPVDEQPAESTDEPDETPTEDEPEEDDADEEADDDTPEVFQEDDTDEKEED